MPKLIGLIRRKSSLSPEEFRDYYENHHVPLVMAHISGKVETYRRNYPTVDLSWADRDSETETAETAQDSTYDCITEMSFRDQAQMDEMFAAISDPDVKAAIDADE